MQRGQSQGLVSGIQWWDQKQRVQTEMEEVLLEHQETVFHCEHDQALAQALPGACDVSIQKLFEHGYRQPLLGEHS